MNAADLKAAGTPSAGYLPVWRGETEITPRIGRVVLARGRDAVGNNARDIGVDVAGLGKELAPERRAARPVGDRRRGPRVQGRVHGASQLRRGRFNAWGTLIAVLLLGTGVVGLGLVSAPNWAPAMFTGVVLIAAG